MRKQVLQCSAHFCGHATETLRSIQVPTEGAAIHTPLLSAEGQGMQTGCCGSSVCQDQSCSCAAELQAHLQGFTRWVTECPIVASRHRNRLKAAALTHSLMLFVEESCHLPRKL